MNVAPGAAFEATTSKFAHSATVGVRIRDGQGSDAVARTTSGVTEDVTVGAAAVFRKSFTAAPSTAGQYWVVWDDGATVDVQELFVTYTTPSVGASTGDYITEAQLKAARELTGRTFADGEIPTVITAASRVIDDLCGKRRRFWLDADATQVRYYSADQCDVVEVDDIAVVTTVETDNNGDGTYELAWATTDFQTDPLNAVADGRPWERIYTTPSGRYRFPHYRAGVKVTGKFGWLTVPTPVVEATYILATRYLLRAREAPAGIIAIGTGLDGSMMRLARTDPDIPGLLSAFNRKRPLI